MNQKLRILVYTALMTALCCVATMAIPIPTPTGGYLNAGDIVIIFSALFAGPLYGAIAAGVGAGLADVLAGYFLYAPGTFVIKACVAIVAGLIFRSGKKNFPMALLAAICGELVMVAGYFGYEAVILGYGMAAAAEIVGNLMQGITGVAGGIALYYALHAIPQLRQFSDLIAEQAAQKKQKKQA